MNALSLFYDTVIRNLSVNYQKSGTSPEIFLFINRNTYKNKEIEYMQHQKKI